MTVQHIHFLQIVHGMSVFHVGNLVCFSVRYKPTEKMISIFILGVNILETDSVCQYTEMDAKVLLLFYVDS